MSRSYAHKPKISWIGYQSNKEDKRIANRIFRRISKLLLKQNKEPLHFLKEVSDTWNFSSDGLSHYNNAVDKTCLRK